MGLDAVVYRKRDHLQLGRDEERAIVIPSTGEVYFDDDVLSRKYRNKVKAAAHRLGNVALIGALRDEASNLIGPESFLGRKILNSGTHCGDAIPFKQLNELSVDLDRIRETGRASTLMQEFVSALEDLIHAASDEGNPIVFV